MVQYYGAIESEKRQKNIELFQDPESPVKFFVGNPQTGGYGITLTAANTVVYYSNGYDLEKKDFNQKIELTVLDRKNL